MSMDTFWEGIRLTFSSSTVLTKKHKNPIYPNIRALPGHLTGMHLLLSLSFVGQPTPPFFSLLIIFLIRNFRPLLHFLEHDVHGDHPVTIQSAKSKTKFNLLKLPNQTETKHKLVIKFSDSNALITFILIFAHLTSKTICVQLLGTCLE